MWSLAKLAKQIPTPALAEHSDSDNFGDESETSYLLP